MGLVLMAAVGVWATPLRAEDKKAPDQKSEAVPRMQMAILLDTSNSMDGLINQAKTQLWRIVNEFTSARLGGKKPVLQVALYEYGKSSLPPKEGFLRMVVPLTEDLDRVSEALFALRTNGGQEYCGKVIDAATRELDWSKLHRDVKCVFIAGNEPFTQGDVDYKKACRAAVEKGITISTIFCGPHQRGISTGWQDGARLADGSYASIDQHRAVAAVPAPQDKELAQLSAELSKTYIPYGGEKKRKEFADRQAAQDANAAKAAASVAAARAGFKASGFYRNAGWDLLDAVEEGKVKLEEVTDDQLPENLRKMSVQQRKTFLAEKFRARKQIHARIQLLSDARKKYVAKEQQRLAAEAAEASPAEATPALDAAIIDSAKKQAAEKHFKFE